MIAFSETFLDKVLRACREHGMFPPGGGKVLAAVSGGPDSVCMLHSLVALKEKLGLEIAVAHLDHAVRGDASAADARFVRDLAACLGLEFHAGRIGDNVPLPAGGGSPEALLRSARHNFLADTADAAGASRIALAHNRDDQVETVLMRILRGTSLLGAAGMRPVNGNIVRPLFFIPRTEIEEYCRENRLEFRTDETNSDVNILRNRIRHTLLPFLEDSFNPAVRRRIFNLAELLSEDADFLENMGKNSIESLIRNNSPGRIELDIAGLAALPDPLLKRAVRSAALSLLGSEGGLLDASHIDAVASLVRAEKRGLTAEIPRLRVTSKYETLEFTRSDGAESEITEEASPAAVIPEGAKSITLPGFDMELLFDDAGFDSGMLRNPDPFTAYFDKAALLKEKLSVRSWRGGDTFHPLGAPGSKKLSDFFVDEKIDRGRRGRIPLLLSGDTIAWAIGVRIGHQYRMVPGKTGAVLKIAAREISQRGG